MNNSSIIAVLLQCFFFFSTTSLAQKPISFQLNSGMILGAPYTKPPEGATGQLGKGPLYGLEMGVPIMQKFSIRGGVYYSIKGGKFQSPIEGKYDVAEGILGLKLPFPLKVNYTGDVDGAFENRYLDFPVYLRFRPFKLFSFGAGYQFSKLLKGKMTGTVDVKALLMKFNDEPFDQSEMVNKNDGAFLAELNFHFSENFEAKLRGSLGAKDVLIEDASGMGVPRNYYLGVILGAKIL